MAGADYEIVQECCDRVFIVDLDLGGRSVTNDAEAVCEAMQKKYRARRVIYRDTMGCWSEMVVTAKNGIAFKPYDEYFPEHLLEPSL